MSIAAEEELEHLLDVELPETDSLDAEPPTKEIDSFEELQEEYNEARAPRNIEDIGDIIFKIGAPLSLVPALLTGSRTAVFLGFGGVLGCGAVQAGFHALEDWRRDHRSKSVIRDRRERYRMIGEDDQEELYELLEAADNVWHGHPDTPTEDLDWMGKEPGKIYESFYEQTGEETWQEMCSWGGLNQNFEVLTYSEGSPIHRMIGEGVSEEDLYFGQQNIRNMGLYEKVSSDEYPHSIEAAREQI